MRYYDQALIDAHPREHGVWNAQMWGERDYWRDVESAVAEYEGIGNAAGILPRDAWLEMDGITRRVMRNDEGAPWMNILMRLAKPVNIGKIVHLNRVSSDAGTVVRSISGQNPVPLDKVTYDYRGTLVPMFLTGYGREWREWKSYESEGFDALADDQEAHAAKIKRDMALYALNGDATMVFQGYQGYGIRTHPLSKSINVGPAGNNINLTTATADALDNFFTVAFGALLDASFISGGVDLFVSPEIGRAWDKTYSGSAGFKDGSIRDFLLKNRRINSINITFELTGNEFFWFQANAEYIRPIVGMAVTTTAIPRDRPRANYQFELAGAMGIEIRADINGLTAVGYSVSV
jgi:Family of unknown function (DUF6260)